MECTAETNRKSCPCTYEPCGRKGRCCECIAFHRESGELPGCLFSASAERTFDRSVARFLADRKH